MVTHSPCSVPGYSSPWIRKKSTVSWPKLVTEQSAKQCGSNLLTARLMTPVKLAQCRFQLLDAVPIIAPPAAAVSSPKTQSDARTLIGNESIWLSVAASGDDVLRSIALVALCVSTPFYADAVLWRCVWSNTATTSRNVSFTSTNVRVLPISETGVPLSQFRSYSNYSK